MRNGHEIAIRRQRNLWRVAAIALACILPSFSMAQEPAEWRVTRDLRIDAAQHDLTLITPPGAMAVSRSGVIAVTQNQDGTIRFFSADGESLGSFGRKGQGPGEFQQMTRFMWSGDTLVVSDQRSRRLTLISPDRKLLRTVPWLTEVSMPSTSATSAPRFIVSFPRMRFADGGQLVSVSVATGSPEPAWPGGAREGTPFLRVDSAGNFKRLLAWSSRRQCSSYYDAGNGMGSGTLTIPYCAQTIEEVSPEGVLLLTIAEPGNTSSYRVMALRENGDTVFNRSYRYQSVSIPQRARDSVRVMRARGSQSQRDAAAAMPIPETYPPIARVLPGRDQTTWLETYGAAGARSWRVLDERGEVQGRVTFPANVQVMVASRDIVWGIETDADGLQHIIRYRVSR